MGAPDKSVQEDADLCPIEYLREMSELLDMVEHWRMKYERLRDEKDERLRAWRRRQKEEGK